MSGRKNAAVSIVSERPPSRSSLLRSAAAFLAFGLAVNAVWAAGLGRLTVRSALGQPLSAEVEIASLTRDEAATISARLGSPEAFRQAGLELTPSVAGLRFSIDRRADGSAVVLVRSTQPISEPFIDLVIELSWASGRFVRGYTFLLDPPELRAARREVVEGGAARRVPTAPAISATTESAAGSPPAPAALPAAARQPRPAPQHAAGDRIPVGAGVTLRSIASRVRPEGVTLEQAQVALYRANPSAFLGSIHGLRADATLVVPDRAAMLAVDPAQARAEALGTGAVAAPERPRSAPESPRAALPAAPPTAPTGQAGAGTVVPKQEDGKPTSRDRLKLSAPQAAAPSTSADGETAPVSATERSPAREGQLGEFQSRITEIERSILEMQRLLEVKNRQLAELQKLIEEARGASRVASGAPGSRAPSPSGQLSPGVPSTAVTSSPAPAPAAPGATGTTVAPPPASPPGPQPANPEPSAPGVGAAPGGPTIDAAGAPAPSPDAKPGTPVAAAPVAKPPPPPAAPPGFFEELLAQPFTLPGLGAIVLLGVAYGWYAMRRRRKVEHFEDSLVSSDGLAANSLFGATGGQSVDTGDGGLGRGSGSATIDVHAAEVDPIAEAEVYIAYGREAQAEEILREALLRQPERHALRLKLLEIHAGRHDVTAFARLAEEMFAATGGRNEEWPRVVALGSALDPTNPLFADGDALRKPEPEVSERLDAILAPPPAAAPRERPGVTETEPPIPSEPMLEFGPIEMRGGGRQGAELAVNVPAEVASRPALGPSASAAPGPVSEAPRMPSSGPSPEDGQTSAGSPVTAPSAEQTTVRTDDEGALPAVRAVPERAPLDFAPLDFDLGLPREKEPVVVSEATAPAAIVASSRTEPRIPPPDFSLDFAPLELPSEASTGRADDALSVTGAPVPAAEAEEPVAPPADLRPASVETARPAPAPDEARSQVQARGRTELERAIDGRFELPSLDLSGVPDLPPAASNRPPADSEPADFSAMRFDIEAAAVIDTPEDARSQDLATRLDLAAAFAEIGDKAGARELLEQVLEEGDPQLRGRARSMLDELG